MPILFKHLIFVTLIVYKCPFRFICLVYGDVSANAFPVRIGKTKLVGDLKKALRRSTSELL